MFIKKKGKKMIIAYVPKLKSNYAFNTDVQSAVEYFCGNVLNLSNKDYFLASIFFPHKTYSKYSTTCIQTKVLKKGYSFKIGTSIKLKDS
jgi:hypothetical protein